MKVSLVCPAHNEEKTISKTLDSIFSQTKIPDEVIFIEDDSSDMTYSILEKYEKKHKSLKIFQVKNQNIAKNRNFGISKSEGDIIVSMDCGCVMDKNYIKNITEPFIDKKIKFVGGFSKIPILNLFDKCFSDFVVKPKVPRKNFIPIGHVMVFRKETWEKVGGYPEKLAKKSADDTGFGKKILALGIKIPFIKNAIVYKERRKGLGEVYKLFRHYGYWDAKVFSFSCLPVKSRLNVLISIFPPFVFIHAGYKGLKLFFKTKKIKAFFYGVGIDVIKIYGYSFGLIKGAFKKDDN